MRKIVPTLAMMVMAVTLAVSGVALADVFDGDDRDNRLVGTDSWDTMRGYGGDDEIRGLAGRDRLFGDTGSADTSTEGGSDTMYGGRGKDLLNGEGGVDLIFGGPGDDYISSIGDDERDFVDCGPGTDTINQEFGEDLTPKDVYRNCEKRAF